MNPVTYILQGMRHLVLEGWSIPSLMGALGAICGMAAFTLSMTLAALRSRTG
jgi:ABC-type multidrug transport system permease subunit